MLCAAPAHTGEDDFFYRRGLVQYRARLYRFAIEDMEKALAINPSHFEAANVLGKIYESKKLMKKALDYYGMSLATNPSQPDIHYRTAVLYDFFYNTRASSRHYLKAVELDPAHREAHLKLVRHYIVEKKDTAAADRHLSESYQLGKPEGDPILKEADREYGKGNEKSALGLYRKAVKKNPADLAVYFRIAEIYRRERNYRQAVRWLEKVKHIRPDNERAHVLLGDLYFTTPLSHNRKFLIDMAIKNLEIALTINPKNRDATLLLAEIHRSIGQGEKAEKLFREYEKMEAEGD